MLKFNILQQKRFNSLDSTVHLLHGTSVLRREDYRLRLDVFVLRLQQPGQQLVRVHDVRPRDHLLQQR